MTLSRRSLIAATPLAAMPGLVVPAAAEAVKDVQALIDKAARGTGMVYLPAGDYEVDTLVVDGGNVMIAGVPGRSWLHSKSGAPVFRLTGKAPITLQNLNFDGQGKGGDKPLVLAEDADDLTISGCRFTGTPDSGLWLERCAGLVTGNSFAMIGRSAIFSRDGKGLTLAHNIIHDIGNNAIQVWTSEPAEDGTIVAHNRISKVDFTDGGTGQNGNGIIIFRAGNVIVEGNRISDCAFTAVRNNSGANCQILNNNISRMGEVAIYCEFAFAGAVVTGNIIEETGLGISVTNFDKNGRLATVANNVVRGCRGPGVLKETSGTGIHCEGDATVTGNVVEDTRDSGISLGWGPHSRTLMATGNLVRNARNGIRFSMTQGADVVLIANNRISGSAEKHIVGYDHWDAVTGDLSAPGAEMPPGVLIKDNLTG